MIFHLSYNFSDAEKHQSVNHFIPKNLCSVRHNDLDVAVNTCLAISKIGLTETSSGMVFMSKTDRASAFRMVPLKRGCWSWLILAAEDPVDGKIKYFADKYLPFGSSISCAIYQRFSDAVRHLTCYKMTVICIVNYLDDFLFVQYTRSLCNELLHDFLFICQQIGMPIAEEKTEFACTTIVFLGNLLDGERLLISIPVDKKEKALHLLNDFCAKRKRQ